MAYRKKLSNGVIPYQMQVEATTEAIIRELNIENIDYANCYQSRVGPLEMDRPLNVG